MKQARSGARGLPSWRNAVAAAGAMALSFAACREPARPVVPRGEGVAPAVPDASSAESAPPAEASSQPVAGTSGSTALSASAGVSTGPWALSFEGGQGAYYGPEKLGPGQMVTIYLHGMCANGALECPVFAGAAKSGYLLCPDGVAPCGGGGFMWSSGQASQATRLEAVMTTLASSHGPEVKAAPRALVGYSLGAPAALLQVIREPGRYQRLMLVNASTEPSAAQLKKAGVVRVALVAGAKDATAGKLALAAKRLAAGGIEARFFSLEATGHYFDGASAARLEAPLAWLLASETDGARGE